MPTLANKSTFLKHIGRVAPKADHALIEKAYEYAKKAHAGQMRANGEPFLVHPASTALYLAELGLDSDTIAAGLLHDAVEDADIAIADIKKEFGPDVAFLVQGTTKIQEQQPKLYNRDYNQVLTLQRMFLAMAKDVRAVLVKLADRLHNMETLYAKSPEDQKRIAQQTLDIYAPIANRLGMGELRGRLEDLSFKYLYPEEYSWVEKYAFQNVERRKQLVDELSEMVKKILVDSNIKVIGTDGRVKHKYSLYKKLLRYDRNVNLIHDLVALRIIVPNVATCYEVLGILHEKFRPLQGRIKDYIAAPKSNGYQSLHTTVYANHSDTVEFQIRTPEMHREAEFGIASHWHYKENSFASLFGLKKSKISKKDMAWIKELSKWKQDINSNHEEYVQAIKIDFFKDRIYVRTPKGDIFDLPEGSTPLDFAYRIHTDVGNSYAGARVNTKMVRLNHALANNDIVEIITSKTHTPKRKWLDYVRTSNARSKIRAALRKQDPEENRRIGHEILEKQIHILTGMRLDQFASRLSSEQLARFFKSLEVKNLDQLFQVLGEGSLTFDVARNRIQTNDPELFKDLLSLASTLGLQPKPTLKPQIDTTQLVKINNDTTLKTTIAKCCHPEPQDTIIGYIAQKKGITIHQINCDNVKKEAADEKLVPAQWVREIHDKHIIGLEIIVKRQTGVLREITSEIATQGIGVANIKAHLLNNEQAIMNIDIMIDSLNQVHDLVATLDALTFVDSIRRA